MSTLLSRSNEPGYAFAIHLHGYPTVANSDSWREVMRRFAPFITAVALMLNQCGDAPKGETIYISESTGAFNADPGDTVIVVMDDSSADSISECLNMGGEPIYNPRTTILYCEGIDF